MGVEAAGGTSNTRDHQGALNPGIPFLSSLEKARKPTEKNKDFSLCRTPRIPGREAEKAPKSKEIPGYKQSKEIQKSKERKIREGDGTKVTERAQNTDFCRKRQIFADAPLLLEIQAFGGRRKPQIFAGNRRLGSGTSGASPLAR